MKSDHLEDRIVPAELDVSVVDELRSRSTWIRTETVRLIEIAGVGHYASTFSCAEILATLYFHTLQLRRGEPAWPERDRFLMGKGHAAVGVYPCLAAWEFFPAEWLESYTRLGSPLGDHPDMKSIPGIDFSSGSIGHNLSVGVGMALSAKLTRSTHRVFVLIGDGELHEGQVWEAAMSASHFGLDNLVAIIDANGISLDGPVEEIMSVEPISARWQAFGWNTHEINGNDVSSILGAFDEIDQATDGRPNVVIARTLKGKGVSFMERDPGWHLGYLGTEDRERALRELTSTGNEA